MADPGELRGQLKAKDATIRELKQELQLSEMLVKELQTKVRNYQLERDKEVGAANIKMNWMKGRTHDASITVMARCTFYMEMRYMKKVLYSWSTPAKGHYKKMASMQRVLSCIRNQALFCAIGIMKANKAQAALDEVLEVVRVKDTKLMQRVMQRLMNRELNFGFRRLSEGLEDFRLHGAAAEAQAKQDELDKLENARRLRLLAQMLKRMQNVLLHRAIQAMMAHLTEDKAAAALAALGDQNSEQLDALENERRLRILAAILKRMQNMLLNCAIRAMVAQWTTDKADAKSRLEKGIWKQQQQFVAAAGDSKLNHLKLQARIRALAFMIQNMARREMTRWLGMLQRQFYRALAAKGGCQMHRERHRGTTRSPTKANSFCAGHERERSSPTRRGSPVRYSCASCNSSPPRVRRKKIVRVYKNDGQSSCDTGTTAVLSAVNHHDLLSQAASKLDLPWAAKRMFTVQGMEIYPEQQFTHDEIVISMGENFKQSALLVESKFPSPIKKI